MIPWPGVGECHDDIDASQSQMTLVRKQIEDGMTVGNLYLL